MLEASGTPIRSSRPKISRRLQLRSGVTLRLPDNSRSILFRESKTSRQDLALCFFPLKGAGRARFIGTVKREAEARHDLTFDDVSPRLINRLDIKVERVNWLRASIQLLDSYEPERIAFA